jgi:hypothetical protein
LFKEGDRIVTFGSRPTAVAAQQSPYLAPLICSIVVLLFNAAAAALARLWSVSFGDFVVPEAVMYFVIGLVLRRSGTGWLFIIATLFGISALDSTVGRQIAIWIGPGRTPPTSMVVVVEAFVAAVLSTTLVGAIGAFFGGAIPRRRGP